LDPRRRKIGRRVGQQFNLFQIRGKEGIKERKGKECSKTNQSKNPRENPKVGGYTTGNMVHKKLIETWERGEKNGGDGRERNSNNSIRGGTEITPSLQVKNSRKKSYIGGGVSDGPTGGVMPEIA